MQGSQRVRWTAWYIEVHWNQLVQIPDNLITAVERPAGDGTGAAGNNYLRAWDSLPCGDGGLAHIYRDWPSNMDTISVAGGGDKLDAKPL